MFAVTKERNDTRFAPRLATLLAGVIVLGGLTACSSYRSTPAGMATAPATPAAAPTGPAGQSAVTGPARRSGAGHVRCGRGDLEPQPRVHHAPAGPVRGHLELRSRLHRPLRDPGQLRRHSDLGHLGSGESRLGRDVRLSRLAERRLRLRAPSVRVRRGVRRAAGLWWAGRRGGREPRPAPRHPHLRYLRHHRAGIRRQRPDLPRLSHAHRS